MREDNKIVPIFFATDDTYMPFLCVALKSIINKCSISTTYNIHILNTGLSEDSKRLVDNMAADNFNIYFDDITEQLKSIESFLHTRDYFSKTTYFRIFIPTLYPQYDKALYLDCDIVVNCDIAELFEQELGDNYVAGAPCEAMNTVAEFTAYAQKFLGIKVTEYFNAGILVMNLKVLRAEQLTENFLHLLSIFTFTVAQDQDYLNVLCHGRAKILPKIWNKMPVEVAGIELNDIKIIHYNLSFKPWHYSDILYEEIFWETAAQTLALDKILAVKAAFSDAHKAADRAAGERLKSTAAALAVHKQRFITLLRSGKIMLRRPENRVGFVAERTCRPTGEFSYARRKTARSYSVCRPS